MGQKAALIIATADYQDTGLARLAAPGLDAHDFAGALQSPHIGAFDSVQTLLNEAEPVARRAIARFFSSRKPDDLLLLYFSGHGVRDDHGQLYLAVSDTDRSLLSATAIPANFINEQMNASRSRRLVLILDCCNSGAFAQGSKSPLGGSMGIATAFEGTGYGRVVLTATDATQYAWEGDEARGEAANSVFTHFLVQGLATGAADANGDGRITLDELYDYVYEQVVTQTPRQTPRKFAYNQEGDVVIAHNPRPTPRPAELPVELRQALESPLMGVREGAVRELDSLLRGSHRGLALAALEALERLSADDSRRVSAAAEASLAAHAEAQRQAQAAQAAEAAARDQAAREQARQRAAEKTAAEKAAADRAAQAEAERQARQRATDEANRLAAAQAADRQSAEATAERQRSALQAEQERQARQRAVPPPTPDPALPARLTQGREEAAWKAEQPQANARQQVDAAPGVPVLARLEAAWPQLAPWVFTLLAMIGWGYAGVAGDRAYGLVYKLIDFEWTDKLASGAGWVTLHTLGTLATVAVLALTRPSLRGWRAPLVVAGLFGVSVLAYGLTWLIADIFDWSIGLWVGLFMVGGLGGALLAWALAGVPRTQAGWRWAGVMVAGWGIGAAMPFLADILFGDALGSFGNGALVGLIGGGVMFWQLRKK